MEETVASRRRTRATHHLRDRQQESSGVTAQRPGHARDEEKRARCSDAGRNVAISKEDINSTVPGTNLKRIEVENMSAGVIVCRSKPLPIGADSQPQNHCRSEHSSTLMRIRTRHLHEAMSDTGCGPMVIECSEDSWAVILIAEVNDQQVCGHCCSHYKL
jgi:hypothetical protein